jgi:hypothetical protein
MKQISNPVTSLVPSDADVGETWWRAVYGVDEPWVAGHACLDDDCGIMDSTSMPFDDDSDNTLMVTVTSVQTSDAATAFPRRQTDVTEILKPPSEGQDTWQGKRAWGIYHSKLSVEATEPRNMVKDSDLSNTYVPSEVLQAEKMLLESVSDAPAKEMEGLNAERALRMYYHAKWLASKNMAKAAESRFREASNIAKRSRRRVLAAHALSRLGYYYIFWHRNTEARTVLGESEGLNPNVKSNPLAPFLLGTLDRQAATGNPELLRAAEDRIIAAGAQPSKELDRQHHMLVNEIKFWRKAENSARYCTASMDVAKLLICFIGHSIFNVRQSIFRW